MVYIMRPGSSRACGAIMPWPLPASITEGAGIGKLRRSGTTSSAWGALGLSPDRSRELERRRFADCPSNA